MKIACLLFCALSLSRAALAANSTPDPSWWNKYQYLLQHGPSASASNSGLTVGTNVDVSNECGPQSETYIALDASNPTVLAGGSNEIFRLPMRGYFSSDGGGSWSGVDLPLPPSLSGTHDTRFGSDPSLAFDSRGDVFYSYIVVFFGGGNGVDGTEMAVARSSDGGKTWPAVTFFSFATGGEHFNDKPMITVDTGPTSRFRDRVYVAWDAASGGSSAGGIRVGASADHGATFTVTRADGPSGPGQSIAAVPFVGTNGELYVAYNGYVGHQIVFNRSLDGGATWGTAHAIASQSLGFQALIPAQSFRGALVYPACDVDRSTGKHRGRLVCSWMDVNSAGNTDIFVSFSDDKGDSWSTVLSATDRLGGVDRFNHWLSIDPTTGGVFVSFYDTRNDTTGARRMFDEFLSVSSDGGQTFAAPNLRVSTASSNEHDCGGVFPCAAIDYGNQTGDYEGLVAFGGVAHPIWTDSRRNQQSATGCSSSLMEEVFTAAVSR
jgi:hypothetical protein